MGFPGIFKLFRSDPQRGTDYEALIETECPDCFIRVAGYKDQSNPPDPRFDSVFISLFTSHNKNNDATWKWRRKRIWNIIRGYPDPDYEILTVEVMDNLVLALQECRKLVWTANKSDAKPAQSYHNLPSNNQGWEDGDRGESWPSL